MIRLALVGRGAWGQNYIRTVRELKNCVIPDEYIVTRNYSKLFNKKDIDGVIIASPASTHFKVAKDFLEKGFNVLIEKPFTTSYKDAFKLQEVQKRVGSLVMVGHIYQYHPAIVFLKKILKKLGKISYIQFESMDSGPVRSDISALWDWAPHDIAICLDLFGESPTEVAGWGESVLRPKTKIYDICFLKMKFNEVSVFSNISWLFPVKRRKITIVGMADAVIFDDTIENKLIYIKDFLGKKKITYPIFSKELPLTCELNEFITCIRAKRKPLTDINSAVENVRIIEVLEKSIKMKGKLLSVTQRD